jgi:5-formyltetrahydrofolate cyclo-ligase
VRYKLIQNCSKTELRNVAREIRNRIHSESKLEIDAIIVSKLKDFLIEFKPTIVAGYRSLQSEVNLDDLYFNSNLEIKWCFPKVVDDHLEFCFANYESDFISGQYGVLEPNMSQQTSTFEIDIFLVPGLLFDRYGHRLGMGKGYYDRALDKVKARKVGIQYKELVLSTSIPHEEHDVIMDNIITEDYVQSLNINKRFN